MKKQDAELQFWRDVLRKRRKHDMGRYPHQLLLPEDYFTGKSVLDVGCGPWPYATAFTGCDITGLDELIDEYREAGYPLDRMTYVKGVAESIPFPDDSFDAVISMNALDHVEDFEAAVKEIERVSRGFIRVELHYHRARVCEPQELSDERVLAAFSVPVKKVREIPYSDLHPGRSGTLAVWSTY